LMFVSGVMGKFIRILPITVISCLAISLIECLIMLPAHLSHLPDPNDPERLARQHKHRISRIRHAISEGLEWFVHHLYVPFLGHVLEWRYFALCTAVSVLLVTVGLVKGGVLQFVMFPAVDGTQLTATVEFPNGTPIDVTQDALGQIEDAIRRVASGATTSSGEPLIENLFAVAGTKLSNDPSQGRSRGPHLGSVRVTMPPSEDRGIHSKKITALWEKEIGIIPGAILLGIEGDEAGPPGKPIEIWLQGHDMDQILAAADDLVARLREFKGVSQVASDFRPGKNEIRFHLKPEARALGLTVRDLASQVYAGFYGQEALRLQRGRDDIRVRVRYPLDERRQLSELDHVRVRTPLGGEVPLKSVADLSYGPGYASITRTDGLRRVAVSAEVDTEVANTKEIVDELSAGFFGELRQRYRGLSISAEGFKRDTQESLNSLYVGFPLALIGIFVIIATIFRSYLQPFVIMITVPFGIIGALLGHLVMGFDVTMISLFGIVALSGVVVNDAIILIECINSHLAEGMSFFEAVKQGGGRRFRAIFLTTISTCGGLTPIILEKDMQAQFLIPMALSLAFGVAFATLLTLLLVPCLLGILNDLRRVWHSATTGHWVAREEVEPARGRRALLLEATED